MDRITQVGLNTTAIGNTQKTLAKLATYQEQLATGKKLNRISDDVVLARQSLRYRADENATGKYLDNIDKSLAYLGATDTALGEIAGIFDEVKAIAVQGANATQDRASRFALAQAVDSHLKRMVDVANTVHDGRFVFGGTATTAGKPFAESADGTRVDYSGNLDTFAVEVGPNAVIAVNQDGHTLFKADTDIFGVLIGLRDALRDNDPTAVATAIEDIDAAQGHANDLVGSMGGRIRRLELARTQLETSRVYQQDLISQAEDADFTETISKMQLTQVALEAGLQSAARTITPTLLDFLR